MIPQSSSARAFIFIINIIYGRQPLYLYIHSIVSNNDRG